MARRTDAQFLRWIAGMPDWRHQPFYEALRLNEIADHLEKLEAENADLRLAMDVFLKFLDRQARLLSGNMEVVSDVLVALKPLLEPGATPLPTAAVAGDLPLPGEELHIDRLTEVDALPPTTAKAIALGSLADAVGADAVEEAPWDHYAGHDDPSLDYTRLNKQAPPFVRDEEGDAPWPGWFNGNWQERAYRVQEHFGTLLPKDLQP